MNEFVVHETMRPRNQTSQKKKLITLIKKQKDKKLHVQGYKKKKRLAGYSNGQWTLRQLKLYHRYLSTHKNEFTDPQLRKRNKVFIKLADFIGSRTPQQCRSHHQKATFKFPDFESLLNNYQIKIMHLNKLYEDVNQISIRQKERAQEKPITKKLRSISIEQCSMDQEKVLENQKIQVKQEESEKISMQEQKIKPQKVDKVTDEVRQSNYYRFWERENGEVLGIEIEEKRMQTFD